MMVARSSINDGARGHPPAIRPGLNRMIPRILPRPTLPLPRLARIPLLNPFGLRILPPLPRGDPSIHHRAPSRIRQILTATATASSRRALLALFLEELHALLRHHLDLASHRVPRVRMALVAGEFGCHVDPPLAEAAALTELTGVAVADVE